MAGAVLTETIFRGRASASGFMTPSSGTIPDCTGGTLLIAIIFVFFNLLVDISYAVLDPRIHYD